MSSNWIAVVGSPRKGKNTDLIVDYIIEGLNEKNIKVDKFYLDSSNVSSCTGCEYCIKTGNCCIKDDITRIIESMKNADGYIFASPTYNYNMTAQMKSLLDRTFCLNDYVSVWKRRLSPGKKAIIVGVCAGLTKESMGYTIESISKPLSELGVKIIDVIEYYNTKHIPVVNNGTIREKIIEKIIDTLINNISEMGEIQSIGISGSKTPLPKAGEGDIDIFIYCDIIPNFKKRQAIMNQLDNQIQEGKINFFEGGHCSRAVEQLLDITNFERLKMNINVHGNFQTCMGGNYE